MNRKPTALAGFRKAPQAVPTAEERRTQMSCLQAFRAIYVNSTMQWKQRKYRWYTYTINPCDHIGKWAELSARVVRYNRYKSYVRSFHITQISKTGMKHVHGLVQMKEVCKFKKLYTDKLYHYQILPYIDEETGWFDYIARDTPTHYYTHVKGDWLVQKHLVPGAIGSAHFV